MYRFRPLASGPVWFMVSLLSVLAIGCGRSAREIDSRLTANHSSTITGRVSGPQGQTPLDGRAVEVVNIESGERLRGSTDPGGGFSFHVRPGRYRIVLALRGGEALVRGPGIIELNRSDRAVHADFVIGTIRVSRPRSPTYRADDGLGSPIA